MDEVQIKVQGLRCVLKDDVDSQYINLQWSLDLKKDLDVKKTCVWPLPKDDVWTLSCDGSLIEIRC